MNRRAFVRRLAAGAAALVALPKIAEALTKPALDTVGAVDIYESNYGYGPMAYDEDDTVPYVLPAKIDQAWWYSVDGRPITYWDGTF